MCFDTRAIPVRSTSPVGELLWRSFRHASACTHNYRAVPAPIGPYDTSLDPQTSGLSSHVLWQSPHAASPSRRDCHEPCTGDMYTCSYKRVKGRSHTVEKRKASHPQKPHATSQPSRFSHTPTRHVYIMHARERIHSPRASSIVP